MNEVMFFSGDHPVASCIIGFWLVIGVVGLGVSVAEAVKYVLCFTHGVIDNLTGLAHDWIQHRNIKAHGWPPAHCDANGDPVREVHELGQARIVIGTATDNGDIGELRGPGFL